MADIFTQESHAERPRLGLPPVASPSILAFYTLAITTFVVGVGFTGVYGGVGRPDYLFASAALFGGLVLVLCAMWAYRALDSLGTAVHGIWGSFYMGLGILHFFIAGGGNAVTTSQFTSLGFWFIPLAVISYSFSLAATRVSLAYFATTILLALGASLGAVGAFTGSSVAYIISGWLFIVAALAAWWTGTGLLLEAVMGYSPLPLFKREAAPAASATREPVMVREK